MPKSTSCTPSNFKSCLTALVRQSIDVKGFSRYPLPPLRMCLRIHFTACLNIKLWRRMSALSFELRPGNPMRCRLDRTAEGYGLSGGALRARLHVQHGKSTPSTSHKSTRRSTSPQMARLLRSFSGCLSKSNTMARPPFLAKLSAKWPTPPYSERRRTARRSPSAWRKVSVAFTKCAAATDLAEIGFVFIARAPATTSGRPRSIST